MDNEVTEDNVSAGKIKHRIKLELKEWDKKKKVLIKNAKKNNEKLAEVEKMEKEMLDRHKKELDSVSSAKETSVVQEKVSNEKNEEEEKRKKKNQKKKEAREKKKLQEESAGDKFEEADKNSVRTQETKAIEKKLKEIGFCIKEMPADGSCLFAAFSDQIEQHRGQKETPKILREKAANWMRDHPSDFIHFCTNEETNEIMSEEEFKKYCDTIESTDEWGGHCEVVALSKVLKCDVIIYSAESSNISVLLDEKHPEKDPFRITYHKHFYGLGEHYNSVVKSE